jgi:hypothetical protein
MTFTEFFDDLKYLDDAIDWDGMLWNPVTGTTQTKTTTESAGVKPSS